MSVDARGQSKWAKNRMGQLPELASQAKRRNLFCPFRLPTLFKHHGSSAKLMKQRKRRLLVDNHRTIEYAWRAASAKTETFAKTVKNPLIAPHPRIINFAEDPASYDEVSDSPIAGDWRGVDGILNGIRAVAMALRDGQGGFELLEVTANEHCALSVHRDFYDGPDNHLNLRYVLYIRIEGDKMAEVWEIPFDLHENDRFNNKQAGMVAKRVAIPVQTT